MKKVKILNKELTNYIVTLPEKQFPKYATQILNLANQNAQGTRPRVVGQLSDLIQEFDGNTFDEWAEWYLERHPDSIALATEKIYEMIANLKVSIDKIDKNMVKDWVEDLVLSKTFVGLCFQEGILKKIADLEGVTYILADKKEESQLIDGYIDGNPVSIKPETYKTQKMLPEEIGVITIFYSKNKDGITIEYPDNMVNK